MLSHGSKIALRDPDGAWLTLDARGQLVAAGAGRQDATLRIVLDNSRRGTALRFHEAFRLCADGCDDDGADGRLSADLSAELAFIHARQPGRIGQVPDTDGPVVLRPHLHGQRPAVRAGTLEVPSMPRAQVSLTVVEASPDPVTVVTDHGVPLAPGTVGPCDAFGDGASLHLPHTLCCQPLPPATGRATALSVLVRADGGKARLGLFDGTSGRPGALLAQTAPFDLASGLVRVLLGGWTQLAGQPLFVGIVSDGFFRLQHTGGTAELHHCDHAFGPLGDSPATRGPVQAAAHHFTLHTT